MLVFALQQVKAKYRSSISQRKDIYHTWLCLAKAVWKVRIILLVFVIASNFVFTSVIPIACVSACAFACVASENHALPMTIRAPIATVPVLSCLFVEVPGQDSTEQREWNLTPGAKSNHYGIQKIVATCLSWVPMLASTHFV